MPKYHSSALPSLLTHLQALFAQAAAQLSPHYAAEVAEAIAGADIAPLEQAMARFVGLQLCGVETASVYETEVVKTHLRSPTLDRDSVRRVLAVRNALEQPRAAALTSQECEELGLPTEIRTSKEAAIFAQSEVIKTLLSEHSPLVALYHPREGSVLLSSPVIAVLAWRLGLQVSALAEAAMLLGLARRVQVVGLDLDGHSWFAKSYERVPEAVQQTLSQAHARAFVEHPSTKAVLDGYPYVAEALMTYLGAREDQSEGFQRPRVTKMPPERLRGLLMRARRSDDGKLTMDDLFREERIGAAPVYGASFRHRFLRPGSHEPDGVMRRNEHPVLRAIADLIGRRDLRLDDTGSPRMEQLVERKFEEMLEQLTKMKADKAAQPPKRRATGWPTGDEHASKKWTLIYKSLQSGETDPATPEELSKKLISTFSKMLRLIADEAVGEVKKQVIEGVQARLGPDATEADAEAALAQEAEKLQAERTAAENADAAQACAASPVPEPETKQRPSDPDDAA